MPNEEQLKAFEAVSNKIVTSLKEAGIDCSITSITKNRNVIIEFKDKRIGSMFVGEKPRYDVYKYKFNLRSDLGLSKSNWLNDEGIWRYYTPIENWKALVKLVINRFKQLKQDGL